MPVWRARYPGVEDHARRRDGLRRQRPGRIEARQHRHLAARHRRDARSRRCTSTAQKTVTLKGERIAEEFQAIVDDYVRATYGGEPRAAQLDPERKTIAVKAIG